MQITHKRDKFHLSYCTNVHPGESWEDIFNNLNAYLPQIKSQVCPDDKFGIGLRLPQRGLCDLVNDIEQVEKFKLWLEQNGLYVFTINAFPMGDFHGARVKEQVYLPDWLQDERLTYTNLVADVLSTIMPSTIDFATISTVPGGSKSRIKTLGERKRIAEQIALAALHLFKIKNKSDREILLLLEPEPCCFLETIDETISFFESILWSDENISFLSQESRLPKAECKELIQAHIGVCYDTCHAAVEYEDGKDSLLRLSEANIRIGKLQISSGLKIQSLDEVNLNWLRKFPNDIYLHQVVFKNRSFIKRFLDLPNFFKFLDSSESTQFDLSEAQCRIHYHVPIYADSVNNVSTTVDFLREVLGVAVRERLTQHLEVETYTFNILPVGSTNLSLTDHIVSELNWVKNEVINCGNVN
ncbi:MAG: metabolite traffic protein EboE [Bdellovibrionota bacterium]